MLDVTGVAGNIFSDKRWAEKYRSMRSRGRCEVLSVSRMEMERLRLRRKTDRGTDVGLVLEPGKRLHHGDVIYAKEKLIIVEQPPERVASFRVKRASAEKMVGMAALAGHAIGNRHRPIAVNGNDISFPIHAESEVAIFRKLLPAEIELSVTERIFQPSVEVHHHE